MLVGIIPPKVMDQAVSALCGSKRPEGHVVPIFDGLRTGDPEAPNEIGRRLYRLNMAATNPSYATLPEAKVCLDYNLRRIPLGFAWPFKAWVEGLKQLQYVRQQCGPMSDHPLFLELDRAIGQIAEHVVSLTKEWEAGPWG